MGTKPGRAATLYQGKYLRLLGHRGWEYVQRSNCSGIVIIVAMTPSKKVIFVEQYRVPVGKPVIEFPAGLVNDGASAEEESMEDAAKREFLEETGYEAKECLPLIEGPASSGLCSELLFFYRARGLKKIGAGGGDETENITVHEVPLNQVKGWLEAMKKKGKLVDPKVYAGIYFLFEEAKKNVKKQRNKNVR